MNPFRTPSPREAPAPETPSYRPDTAALCQAGIAWIWLFELWFFLSIGVPR